MYTLYTMLIFYSIKFKPVVHIVLYMIPLTTCKMPLGTCSVVIYEVPMRVLL